MTTLKKYIWVANELLRAGERGEAAFRKAIANYESIHGELRDIPKKNLEELFGESN